MKRTREDTHDDGTCGVYGDCQTWVTHCQKQGEQGMSCDMLWLGFTGLQKISFHKFAIMDMFYATIMTFSRYSVL